MSGGCRAGRACRALQLDRRMIESHVHFFLGKECSIDEAGTAALKAVELDQALGDEPIQHR